MGQQNASAKFTVHGDGSVTLKYEVEDYDGPSGQPKPFNRLFSCPIDGGVVREWVKGEWVFVCQQLRRRGATLRCSHRNNLREVLRREYRAMRREDARLERMLTA